MFGKHDWNHYYKKIESAEKAYRSYQVDDKHNLKLIKEWEKSVTDAKYYLNKTLTQEGKGNVSEARKEFLDSQNKLINQAKSQDSAEQYMGRYALKTGLVT